MTKTISAIVLLFISLNTYAVGSYVNINSIVLGVNLDPDEVHYHFPCTAGPAVVVFCGDNLTIEDSTCSQTLSYKNVGSQTVNISCQLVDGRNVILARAEGNLTTDNTQDAFGFVNLKMNSAVSIKAINNGKSNVKYLLIVR